jgi:hypothetical protein
VNSQNQWRTSGAAVMSNWDEEQSQMIAKVFALKTFQTMTKSEKAFPQLVWQRFSASI